jgi:hypothetical protein
MSKEFRDSTVTAWITVFAALAFYVLSVPWVVAVAYGRAPDVVVGTYASAYGCLMKVPTMGRPLQDYLLWCGKATRRGPFFVPSE